jgi:hypothetical protein
MRQVGIDIQESEENRALIDAIRSDNPELTIRHLPGLVKLQAAGQIVTNRDTVERQLGRDWETGERDAIAEKDRLSHEVYKILHNFSFAAAFTTQTPSDQHMAWLSGQYPDTFDQYYGRCGKSTSGSKQRAAGCSSRACRNCARSARSRWLSPSARIRG